MPRPPLSDEAATITLRLRVTETQRREIAQVARDNRTNVCGVLREAVNTYVAEYREASVFRPTKPLCGINNRG